jgi:hypothetical protein
MQDGYSAAQLPNRYIDLDARKVLPGTPVAPAHFSRLRAFPIGPLEWVALAKIFTRHSNTEHDGVNNLAIV